VSLLLTSSAAIAEPTIIRGPITSPINGLNYYILSADSWSASEAKARSLGGHLATIRSADEQAWLFSTFGPYVHGSGNGLWIGLTDANHEGEFTWVNGSPVNYTNWSPGEPSGRIPTESYVEIFGPDDIRAGGWNDQEDVNGTLVYGVVEVPHELGVYLSRWQFDIVFNPQIWQGLKSAGKSVAVIQAWGGRTKNPFAKGQLNDARIAGFKTAAYCLLDLRNSTRHDSAPTQIRNAFDAIGDEANNIISMVVDVETLNCNSQIACNIAYPQNLDSFAERNQAILEAIQEVQRFGKRPIIYTSRYMWQFVTGGATTFSVFPLWDAVGDGLPDLILDSQGSATMPFSENPYGGWTTRAGKQYVLDTPEFGILLDYNVFEPSIVR
jgi:hypothetical protein